VPRRPPTLVTVLVAVGLGSVPAVAAPDAGLARTGATNLSPAAAKRMMRTVLERELGQAWGDGSKRHLDCSTAVHPQKDGAAQKNEIRRRCYFSWRYRRARFHGHSLVWLSGRDAEGNRHPVFQMTVYERKGDQPRVIRQSGAAQTP